MVNAQITPITLESSFYTPPSNNYLAHNISAIAKVAEDFEAFFAGLVFEQISSDIESNPITGGGQGEEIFKSLLNQEYGRAIARTHSLGIADIVQRQLLQIQETV